MPSANVVYSPYNNATAFPFATYYLLGNGSQIQPRITRGDGTACYFWDTLMSGVMDTGMHPPDPTPNPATLTEAAITNVTGEVLAPIRSGTTNFTLPYTFMITVPNWMIAVGGATVKYKVKSGSGPVPN